MNSEKSCLLLKYIDNAQYLPSEVKSVESNNLIVFLKQHSKFSHKDRNLEDSLKRLKSIGGNWLNKAR